MPMPIWVAFGTDIVFRWPSLQLAATHGARGSRAFVYLFDWESPAFGGILGSCHALELPFVFGAVHLPVVQVFSGGGTPVETLSAQMQRAWLAFAAAGDPSHDGHRQLAGLGSGRPGHHDLRCPHPGRERAEERRAVGAGAASSPLPDGPGRCRTVSERADRTRRDPGPARVGRTRGLRQGRCWPPRVGCDRPADLRWWPTARAAMAAGRRSRPDRPTTRAATRAPTCARPTPTRGARAAGLRSPELRPSEADWAWLSPRCAVTTGRGSDCVAAASAAVAVGCGCGWGCGRWGARLQR